MQFNECPDITPQKLADLRARILRLGLDLGEVEEKFVRGSGKGGQKINKTSNCVQLSYPRLEIFVCCQRERKRSLNRFLALRELVDRVELLLSPGTSRILAARERIRRNKARRRGRHDAAGGGQDSAVREANESSGSN